MSSPNLDPLLKLAFRLSEFALLIGISTDYLRDQVKQGNLPARKVSNKVVILRQDALKWLEKQPLYKAENEGSSPTHIED